MEGTMGSDVHFRDFFLVALWSVDRRGQEEA